MNLTHDLRLPSKRGRPARVLVQFTSTDELEKPAAFTYMCMYMCSKDVKVTAQSVAWHRPHFVV